MEIKLIIAGGRDFSDYQLLQLETQRFLVESNFNPSQVTIISGKQKTVDERGNEYGADFLGEVFAKKYHFPIEEFPADWNKNGKAAGPIRNEEMAKVATHLIAFHDGVSKGTKSMIENAEKYNLIYKIVKYE